MKFYIIAGEASGDLHASNLVKEILHLNPDAVFRGFGGDKMKEAGVKIVKHYRETAFMGFTEVLLHLPKILGFIKFCKKDISSWKPDAIILVDYPGFNLRIAEFAHENGYKVFYYISPQVWAWKASRVKKIRRDIDRMFVILPFEKDFYRKRNYEVEFVGHPLLDVIENISSGKISVDKNKPAIALLPGSRKQEIASMLPVMLEMISEFPHHQFVVAGAAAIDESFYRNIIGNKNCMLVMNETYPLLAGAEAALVTSGTATLETALFNVPQVVCYRGSAVSFWIGKKLVDVKFISLVNLILDRELVKELIQRDFSAANLKYELSRLLYDPAKRKKLSGDYSELKSKLGGSGASKKTAIKILEAMHVPNHS